VRAVAIALAALALTACESSPEYMQHCIHLITGEKLTYNPLLTTLQPNGFGPSNRVVIDGDGYRRVITAKSKADWKCKDGGRVK